MSSLPGYRAPNPTSRPPSLGELSNAGASSHPSLVNILPQPVSTTAQPSPPNRSLHLVNTNIRPADLSTSSSPHKPDNSAHYLHPSDHDPAPSADGLHVASEDIQSNDDRPRPKDHSRSRSTPSHGPISLLTPLLQGVAPPTATSAAQNPILLQRSYSHSHLHDAHGVLRPGPVHWAVTSSEEEDGRSKSSVGSRSDHVGESKLDWFLRRVMCNGWSPEAKQELRKILYLAVPTSTVDTMSFVASLFSVSLVGSLGTVELSALTLGTTLFNIMGLSLVVGLTSGMDTICGQTYGAAQYAAVGVILQRAVLVCLLLGVPSYAVYWQAGPLLRMLGQPNDIVKLAAEYVWTAAPCLAFTTIKCCCRAYFNAQGAVLPLTLLTTASTLLAPFYNYVFIITLELGLKGAALAYVAEEITAVLLCILLILRHNRKLPPHKRTWTGFSMEAFCGWGRYLQVALPSTAMIVLDWWILELMILLAGLASDAEVQVAAMGLCFNTFTFVYYAVDGFGAAASTRVSHELGGSCPRAAQRATSIALGLGLVACCGWCGVIYLFQPSWTKLFTRDPAVISAMAAAMPWVFLAVLGYSTNTVLSGVLRGAGRQALGFIVNLVTLWLVGLPISAMLSLHLDLGSVGLWIGIAVMNLLQGGILMFKVLQFNWPAEVVRSQSCLSLHMPLLRDDSQDTEAMAGAGPSTFSTPLLGSTGLGQRRAHNNGSSKNSLLESRGSNSPSGLDPVLPKQTLAGTFWEAGAGLKGSGMLSEHWADYDVRAE